MDAIPVPTFEFNSDLTICAANTAACEWLGVAKDAVLKTGLPFAEVDDEVALCCALRTSTLGGCTSANIWLKLVGRTTVCASIRVRQSTPLRFVVTMRPMTMRKRASRCVDSKIIGSMYISADGFIHWIDSTVRRKLKLVSISEPRTVHISDIISSKACEKILSLIHRNGWTSTSLRLSLYSAECDGYLSVDAYLSHDSDPAMTKIEFRLHDSLPAVSPECSLYQAQQTQTVLNNLLGMWWVWDVEHRIMEVSPSAAAYLFADTAASDHVQPELTADSFIAAFALEHQPVVDAWLQAIPSEFQQKTPRVRCAHSETWLQFTCNNSRGRKLGGQIHNVTEVAQKEQAIRRLQAACDDIENLCHSVFTVGHSLAEPKMSGKLKHLLHWPEDKKVTAEAMTKYVHPQDVERITTAYASADLALSMGSPSYSAAYDVRIRQPDGSFRWLHTNMKVSWDKTATQITCLTHTQDIHEQKEQEQHLRLLALAAEQMSASVAICSTEIGLMYVNSAFERMTGYAFSDVKGLDPVSTLTCPTTDKDELQRIYGKHVLQEAFHSEAIWGKKSGETFIGEGLVSPMFGEQSTPSSSSKCTHWICIMYDRTELRQQETAVLEARNACLQSLKMKSEFLAMMSHEIRTPMNGIIGMTRLLLDTNLSRKQRTYARETHECGQQLLALVNDILDFSKIEAGHMRLDEQDCNPHALLESVLEPMVTLACEKGLSLVTYVTPQLPDTIHVDDLRLAQALQNILHNAVKYTQQGEVSLIVSIPHRDATHFTLRFEISDNGPGIAEEAISKLFKPFSDVTNATRQPGSTGLGLVITRLLVEMMHGQVGVHSTVGKGSTFWFTVQLQHAERILPCRMDLGGVRALVMHSNVITLCSLADQLAFLGAHVDGVQTVDEAAKCLKANAAYQYLLSDADEMCAVLQRPAMSVILLKQPSARSSPLVVDQLDSYLGCIVLPLRKQHLLSTIRRAAWSVDYSSTNSTPLPSRSGAPCGLHVLLADDNDINRKVAQLFAEKLGHRVTAVSNGLEAVQAVKQQQQHDHQGQLEVHRDVFDVILMDVQMPELDGLAATRIIRQLPGAEAQVPIIALTANAMHGDRTRCLAAGMNDFISKPFDMSTLRAKLSCWCVSSGRSSPSAALS
eukprot:TRINITY_DN9233_c0_g1_i1.p1 TRINITY_DN9233_c0_g1~~TRINITY_DN9233_c0_g1_i1.p1  ORF type:complete len:1151 (-),score=212.98 TRINITY_DN9233_c0_g1_i1:156-3569(-)